MVGLSRQGRILVYSKGDRNFVLRVGLPWVSGSYEVWDTGRKVHRPETRH